MFKLVEKEVLHQILGLACQKLRIQYGPRRPFWIYRNNNKRNLFFCCPPSNIDNRSETVFHAKCDASITFVTIILLSNWDNRPTFPSSHDTEVSIMVLNILIISKKNAGRCTWKHCDRLQNHRFILIYTSGKGYTHFLHGHVSVIVILLVFMAAISVFTTSTIYL